MFEVPSLRGWRKPGMPYIIMCRAKTENCLIAIRRGCVKLTHPLLYDGIGINSGHNGRLLSKVM